MNRKLLWPFSFNFFHFAAVAAVTPFLVLYYRKLGFNGDQIGLLTGITPLVTLFFAPLWTGLADNTNHHNRVLGFLLLAAASTLLIFPTFKLFLPVLLIAIAFNVFYGPLTSFADSAAMSMLGGQKALYGRIRLGGTIGYGIAAVLTGSLVQLLGLKAAFWSCAGLMLANFFISRRMEFSQAETRKTRLKEMSQLVANKQWFLFLILAFTGGVSLGILSNYLFPLMQELGSSGAVMGFALTIGTIAEIPVMLFSDRLLKKFKAGELLKIALLMTALRFMLYFLAKTPTAILLVQLTNGMTFPAFWIAGVSYADEHAPPGLHTTAQGVFGAVVWGFGNAAGGFAGGPLLDAIGSHALFLSFGVGFLGVLVLVTTLQRILKENQW
ncbi:MAG: MFS transporter [Anaerolineales bacterium]|nr:MFS transporter [Anaerolineales bacterium]